MGQHARRGARRPAAALPSSGCRASETVAHRDRGDHRVAVGADVARAGRAGARAAACAARAASTRGPVPLRRRLPARAAPARPGSARRPPARRRSAGPASEATRSTSHGDEHAVGVVGAQPAVPEDAAAGGPMKRADAGRDDVLEHRRIGLALVARPRPGRARSARRSRSRARGRGRRAPRAGRRGSARACARSRARS